MDFWRLEFILETLVLRSRLEKLPMMWNGVKALSQDFVSQREGEEPRSANALKGEDLCRYLQTNTDIPKIAPSTFPMCQGSCLEKAQSGGSKARSATPQTRQRAGASARGAAAAAVGRLWGSRALCNSLLVQLYLVVSTCCCRWHGGWWLLGWTWKLSSFPQILMNLGYAEWCPKPC